MQKKSENLNTKVKVIKDKKYFNAPVNSDGNPYWIPIVVKNKSYLLGFINSYQFISDIYDISVKDIEIAISSDRLNDVLMDGTRIQTLTRKELKEKLKFLYFTEVKENHPENNTNILNQYYLSVSCVNCGMFYGFKNEAEVPEKDFTCDVCGNSLIMYVDEYDDYFSFDGNSGDVEKIVEEINKEQSD